MGIFDKFRDAAAWVDEVVEKEAPRPKPEPQNDEDVDERQAEMAVVPTQGGGVACLARLGALRTSRAGTAKPWETASAVKEMCVDD
jgi:hypothetical protein